MNTSLSWLQRLTHAPTNSDWERLMDIYAPLLMSWLDRAGVPRSDCDDVIQEVMTVVVRKVTEFEHRGPGAFRAWLRGILALQLRKWVRTRRMHSAIDLDEFVAEESSLSQQWDREHDDHVVQRALAVIRYDFAESTWQAFRMQVIDGRTPHDVVRETDLSLNAVILAKSRVLRRLRQELQGFIDPLNSPTGTVR